MAGPRLISVVYGVFVMCLLLTGPMARFRLRPAVGDDLPSLVRSVSIPLLLLSPWVGRAPSNLEILRAAPILLVTLAIVRLCALSVVRVLRRRGHAAEAAVIVGAGELGQRLADAFAEDAGFGIRPLGFLEDQPFDRLPLPVLGTTADLPTVLAATGARRVIVAFGSARDSDMVSILRACDDAHVTMYVLPRFFELGVLPHLPEIDEVRGMQLVRLRRAALRPSSRFTKRAFDLTVSGFAVVAAAPLFLLGAVLVRLSGSGPILFRQRRIGRNGKTFDVIKFRSMTAGSASDTQWGPAAEERITPVGAFLRRTSLDELPQLWNVIRGDMSIVGPRPERPHFVEIFSGSIRGYNDRLRVPAGLTGWSQVHGLRGDTSIADRATFDNYYVENWSLWLDLRIIVRTVAAVLGCDTPPHNA